MSQPVWTSLDPLTISGNTLDVGHGNWQQNDGTHLVGIDDKTQPEPKWLPRIFIDGGVVYGTVPPMPSGAASVPLPVGALPWSQRLSFDLSNWRGGQTHSLDVQLYAAQFFKGWGDHPGDAWEWGNANAKDGHAAALTRLFTLSASPPVAQPNVPATIAELENVVIPAIVRLEGSDAYKRNFRNVVTGTKQARAGVEAALAFLHGQP